MDRHRRAVVAGLLAIAIAGNGARLDLLWTETGLLAWALLVIFFWRYVSARWRATSKSSLASETGSPA